jgi:hypothetical protein
MQTFFTPQHILGRSNAINPMLHHPLSTPKARKIQHTSTQFQQRIFSHRSRIRGIVLAVSRDPGLLTFDGPDACAAKLDPLIGFVIFVVSLDK